MRVEDADLYQSLDKVVDMDAFLTYWAMEVMTGRWDSYTGNQNNFYTYHDPTSDKFYFIPWGTDGAFAPDHTFLPPDIPVSVYAWSWPTYRLYSDLDSRAKYHHRLRQLLDEVWDEDKLLKEVGTKDGDPIQGTFSGVFAPMINDQLNLPIEPTDQ